MAKQWPLDGQPVDTEEVISDCARAALFRRWEGYPCTNLDIVPPFEERVTPEGINKAAARGISELEVIIGIAFELGIEQGKRIVKSDRLSLMAMALSQLYQEIPEFLNKERKNNDDTSSGKGRTGPDPRL